MSSEITTLGFGKKGAERFIDLLRDAGVAVVVDIRRRPDSTLSGYARRRDLPFILRAFGIGYEHVPELAPPDDLLSRYRDGRDWESYVPEFERRVLSTAEALAAMERLCGRPERVALLCSEATPEKCHRRLVAQRMRELWGVEIRHL